MTSRELLVVARARLLLKQPFFGTLALSLELQEDAGVLTMATDGRRIYYNPAFVEDLSRRGKNILETAVAHEVLHLALGHLWRRGPRQPDKWNAAADFAVNTVLRACGMAAPGEWLYGEEFRDLATEEIYTRLPDPPRIPIPWDVHLEPEDTAGGSGEGQKCSDLRRALAEERKSRVAAAAHVATCRPGWRCSSRRRPDRKLPGGNSSRSTSKGDALNTPGHPRTAG